MAKELPYFRFTVSEWLNGNVSLEGYMLKGVFIDVCSYYWFKDCSITKAELEKRFKNAKRYISQLFDLEIIKICESDYIEISFLNEQYEILSATHKKKQKAGSIGGKKKAINAKAKLKQNRSYKDNNKDNYNNKEKDKDKEKYKDIVFPFDSKKFMDCWDLWLDFRKEIKKPINGIISRQAQLKKISKLSNGNENTAIKIINQSIENNWQGLFELKNKTQGANEQLFEEIRQRNEERTTKI